MKLGKGELYTMYIVYLFREKSTNSVIYVGSSSRPIVRLKEHRQQLSGAKKQGRIHRYMCEHNLKLYDDVSVEFIKECKNKDDMFKWEEEYYFKYIDTLLNERPGEDRTGAYNPRRRKVRCLNDGREFKTVSDCALFYKKGRTTVSNVLNKEKPYTWINDEKYYFEYVSQ